MLYGKVVPFCSSYDAETALYLCCRFEWVSGTRREVFPLSVPQKVAILRLQSCFAGREVECCGYRRAHPSSNRTTAKWDSKIWEDSHSSDILIPAYTQRIRQRGYKKKVDKNY